jgi:hypothetical protein
MNGKIDVWGNLHIERSGSMKSQYCPREPSNDGVSSDCPCGDWCPLFCEPSEGEFPYNEKIILDICYFKSLHFDRFDDQRKK